MNRFARTGTKGAVHWTSGTVGARSGSVCGVESLAEVYLDMAKVPVDLDIEQLAQAIVSLPRKQRAELWALLATFEERADPGAAEALSESEEDVRAGRLFTMEEVFGTTEA